MRKIIRNIFFVIAGFLVLFIFGMVEQVVDYRQILADFQDRVKAVKDFQANQHRLPHGIEVTKIFEALPTRNKHSPRADQYRLQTFPGGGGGLPEKRPAAGGWILCYWQGEWNEYYSSWDDYYSVSQYASVRGQAHLIFMPLLVAALLLMAGLHPAMRNK